MKIVVFGNSIAWGAFDEEKGGWVERLKIYFFGSYSESHIGVYNCSVSGSVTSEIVQTMEQDICKICDEDEDSIIMFATGTNDARYIGIEPVVSEHDFCDHIRVLISLAKKHTTKIMLIGPLSVDEPRLNPFKSNVYYFNERLFLFHTHMKQIAEEEKIFFLSIRDLLQKNDFSDGLHPNSHGHEKIFQVMKSSLEGMGIV